MAIMVQNIEDCQSKLMSILPKMKETGKAPLDQCEELETMFDDLILAIQSSEVEETEMEDIAELLQEVKEVLSCVLNQNEDLAQKVGKLESELECIKKEQERNKEELTSLRSELVTGQIASCFEREIVKAVLDGVKQTDKILAIGQLEDIIRNKTSRQLPPILKTAKQRRQANDNWNKIDKKYSLSHDHYSRVPHLKFQRNLKAHPEMTIKKAMEFLKSKESTSIAEDDRKICIDMLEVLTKMGVPDINTCKKV